MRIVVAIFSVVLVLLLAACGGSSTAASPAPTPTVTIAASTTSATVAAGASQSFSATVSGASNTSVSWSIQEGSAGGTIDATGKYTAPSTPGTYHIVATSMADPTKSAVITVTVTALSNITVSISPTSATLFTGSTQAFGLTVSGTSNMNATWTIQEGSVAGTISPGSYVASMTPGTYHIVATSVADPTKSAIATITILAPPPGSGFFTTQATLVGTYSGMPASPDNMWVQMTDGSILVAGGFVGRFIVTNAAGVLSLDSSGTLTVTQVGNMIDARSGAAAALMQDGRVLIAGGGTAGGPLTTAQIYDPKTRAFTQTGSLTIGESDVAIPQPDGTILVFGTPSCCIANVISPLIGEFYTPATATFGNAFSVSPVTAAAASAVLKDGRILFAGGFVMANPVTFQTVATAQIFDPRSRTLTTTGSMATPRENASATTLPNGRVLVFGGRPDNNPPPGQSDSGISTAEIYDPASGTFSPTGNTLEPLFGASSILLPSGKVLVVGQNSITAELYDPSTGKFSVAAQMPATAQYPRLFNMPNGTAMVALSLSGPFNFYHP